MSAPWRVLAVVGTRPEAIKVAPLVVEAGRRQAIDVQLLALGQHGPVLLDALRPFGVRPVEVLDLPRVTGSLAELASVGIAELDAALHRHGPDLVVVQGDTLTGLLGALAAFWRRIPVAHLEAGLRTHDLSSPFPEEANRQLIARIASLHLAPTGLAADHLQAEAVGPAGVHLVGNTVVDALLHTASLPVTFGDPAVGGLVAGPAPLVLVTAHRRENWGAPLAGICRAVARLADDFADHRFLIPLHPNPAVRDVVTELLGPVPGVTLTGPLPYPEFAAVLARATLVLSDSGGVQEEAPTFGVPVLVLRDTTERPEGVEAGVARLIGTDPERIVWEAAALLADPAARAAMRRAGNPYGDGTAAARSLDHIEALLRRDTPAAIPT